MRPIRNLVGSCGVIALVMATGLLSAEEPMTDVRVGMIGLDTSHVVAFTKILNGKNADPRLKGVRVVAAFPAGSPDFPLSRDRLAGFTEQVRAMDVEIVGSIEELLPKVDAILLMSVDGRVHRAQFESLLAAKKPVFIDKPVAADLADVIAIYDSAATHGTPVFSCSSSRFTPGYPELRTGAGEVLGADVYSQTVSVPGHPDLFFYGVHGGELLYAMMGAGCDQVTALQTPLSEQVTGVWKNGRVGTFRGIREKTGKAGVGATAFGTTGIVSCDNGYDYKPLVGEIATFFRTGTPPVSPEETIKLFAFLTAAEKSKAEGGRAVTIAEVLEEARSRAAE